MIENTPTPAELKLYLNALAFEYPMSDIERRLLTEMAPATLEAVTAERDNLEATAKGWMQSIDRLTTERDALAAMTEQVRAALGGASRDEYSGVVVDALDILSTAPATVLAQRDARALREAADDIAERANVPRLIELADRYAGYYAGSRSAMQNEESKLRERADRIEREAAL